MEGPKLGPKRQRWWCQPKTGGKHRFRETLPRIVAADGEAHSCRECQTKLAPWEGQPAPRLYGFSARDVAWALVQVAGGASYRGTAALVRTRAGRELDTSPRGKNLPAPNTHAQLISDWVDVFAPVIWAAYAPTRWPESVLLDEDTLKYSAPGSSTGHLAFYVLGAMSYDGRGRPYVAALEAVPRLSATAWDKFLRTLDMQPQWVVSDGGSAVMKGARKAWPDAEMWRCEWHLRRNLEEKLPDHVRTDPADPLRKTLNFAQLSVEHWETYRNQLHKRARAETGFHPAQMAAAKLDSLIRAQAGTRPDDLPLSTGPLEQYFHTMDKAIGDRAARMTNKRRTDALLKLLAAHRNGWIDHDRWTDILREHLEVRRGHAPEQRQHTDPRTAPSLR